MPSGRIAIMTRGLTFLLLAALAGPVGAVPQPPSSPADLARLVDQAVRSRNLGRLRELRPEVRAAALAETTAAPDLLLALGRLERALGNADEAMGAFAAFELSGAHPGLADLEMARTSFTLLPRSQAEQDRWFRGAASDDPVTVAAYRADLLPILTPEEKAEFDGLGGGGRVTFLREFWTRRDGWALRRPGARLPEHYRRLEYARKHFGRPAGPRTYKTWERIRTGEFDFDDRGLVYVRHGPPSAAVNTFFKGQVAEGAPDRQRVPFQVWRYDNPEGELVFYFRACARPSMGDAPSRTGAAPGGFGLDQSIACEEPLDFRLVSSPLDWLYPDGSSDRLWASEPFQAPTGFSSEALYDRQRYVQAVRLGTRRGDLNDPAGFMGRAMIIDGARPRDMTWVNPVFQACAPIAVACARLITPDPYDRPALAARVRDRGEAHIATALSSDSWLPRYTRPLAGRVEVLGLSTMDGEPMLHFTYAVRGRDLVRQTAGDRLAYPVRLRAAIRDARTARIVALVDSVKPNVTDREIGGDDWVMGHVAVPAPGGVHDFRLALEVSDETGYVSTPGSVTLETPRPDRLSVSDLVLGARDVRLTWRPAAGDTVWMNPSGAYSRRAPLELYYQVFGVPAGEEFTAELSVARVGRGLGAFLTSPDAVAASFTERSRGVITPGQRALDLTTLPAGKYEAAITITDARGTRVEKTRRFELRD